MEKGPLASGGEVEPHLTETRRSPPTGEVASQKVEVWRAPGPREMHGLGG